MAKKDVEAAKPGTWVRETPSYTSKAQVAAGLSATALLAAAALHTIGHFIPAIIWAVIIAVGLWPTFDRLGRRWPKHRRELLPALMVLAVLLVFVVPLTMIAVPAATDAHNIAQWVQQVRTHGLPPPAFLPNLPYGDRLSDLWRTHIGEPGAISDFASHNMQGGLMHFGRRVGQEALHRLVLLGFMLLALFFLLREGESVVEQLRVGSRRAFGPSGEDVGRQMVLSVHGTINGLVLVGLGEGVVLGVVYALVGLPHATLFALMSAILAMIPFGTGLALAVAAVVLLAVNKVVATVIVLVVGFAVTFIADHFIRPTLIGGATKLPFVWVLFGILGGVETWGLMGLFVGPALLAAIILLWREWVGSERGPLNPNPAEAHAADHRSGSSFGGAALATSEGQAAAARGGTRPSHWDFLRRRK